MQIARIRQRGLGSCPYRGTWVIRDQIDAQASDNGMGVVLVQSVEDKPVVKQGRGLAEHLSSQVEVNIRPGMGHGIGGRHELRECWT